METFSMDLNGRELVMETGKLAKQASGAVLVRYGETLLLVTATGSDTPREDANFLPLTVDYEERHYAVGKMPGGFIKREGRPSEKATLAARLTDRPLRPLFPKKFYNSIHVVATVLSVDQDSSPETLAIIGASAALSISKIPFKGPIGAVMVGLVNGEPVVNPRKEELENNPLRLVVAGTKDAIMMVESSADEISDEKIVECIERGHEEIKRIVALQEEMVEKVGVPKMEIKEPEEFPEDVISEMESGLKDKLGSAMRVNEKKAREDNLKAVKDEFIEKYLEIYPESKNLISSVYENNLKATMRKMILQENLRPDGRKTDEIRPISCEVGILPRTHGSALFTRGQTQVLNICTLAGLREVQIVDGLGIEDSKRYIHHYNFPAYSVGETGFMRGPGRREIGHGVLAENALKAIIPDVDEFPYTVRLVSEVLESNGSTSMGSVCASSLALMNAGVTVKKHVSGIAMGLIKEEDGYAILSDIQGMEDFLGDMDFKVAGTRDGITALQMDIKITGISREIMIEAIAQAKKGYFYIMDKMEEAISAPNEEMSPYAPRIITTQVAMDKIRDIIGPGGRVINKIIEETGVGIDIEPDGKVFIAAVDPEAGKKALETIQNLVREVTAGETFVGKVTRVEKYGAFVEILPGKEGLVHISQLDFKRVENTEDIVNLGDEVLVKVIGVDDRGRIDLSRKDAMEPPPGYKPPSRDNSRPPRSGGDRSRGDRDRNKRF